MRHSGTPSQRAEHYRQQAAQLRDMAEQSPVGTLSDQLLDLSQQYERLAEEVEQTTRWA